MTSINGYAACKVRVASDDAAYSDLPKRPGSLVRFALYYRGFLVWKATCGWAFSKAEVSSLEAAGGRSFSVYRRADGGPSEYGLDTRREAIEAVDAAIFARLSCAASLRARADVHE